ICPSAAGDALWGPRDNPGVDLLGDFSPSTCEFQPRGEGHMPTISKFHLYNAGGYDAWLGAIWIDKEGMQHGPVWDPKGYRIPAAQNGYFDIGNISLAPGVTVW